jgi:hypothetical protein
LRKPDRDHAANSNGDLIQAQKALPDPVLPPKRGRAPCGSLERHESYASVTKEQDWAVGAPGAGRRSRQSVARDLNGEFRRLFSKSLRPDDEAGASFG